MPMTPSVIRSLGATLPSRPTAEDGTAVASEAAAAAVVVAMRKSRREGLSGKFIKEAPKEGAASVENAGISSRLRSGRYPAETRRLSSLFQRKRCSRMLEKVANRHFIERTSIELHVIEIPSKELLLVHMIRWYTTQVGGRWVLQVDRSEGWRIDHS